MSVQLHWNIASLPQELPAGAVHVWAWDLDPAGFVEDVHLPLLDTGELVRYGRFRFEADRARFALSHATLRRILGAYLGADARELGFEINEYGKPRLRESANLEFNLSHSKTVGAVALSRRGQELGLDIEEVRPIEAEVAESHFSTLELTDMETLRGDAWREGFYRCWTRKEAILKAEGVGLGIPLDAFDVTLLADAPAVLRGFRPESHLRRHWRLRNMPPARGVAGALAFASETGQIETFQTPV